MDITWQKRGNRQHPEWDNTSLGQIDIRPGTLEIEVNSENRAAKIRQEIQSRLAEHCALLREERQTAEDLFREQEGRPRVKEPPVTPPELREVLKQQMAAHWDAWLDIQLPALKDRTPREVARTPQGRERLEAVLMAFEYRNQSPIQPELRPDVEELRRKLRLPGQH